MNCITVIGNAGADAELRQSRGGTSICAFNLAENARARGNDGEWGDVTTWYRVTVFGARAEGLAREVTKGRRLAVVGELRPRAYKDRAGVERLSLDITANNIDLLGKREGRAPNPENDGRDEDIPY